MRQHRPSQTASNCKITPRLFYGHTLLLLSLFRPVRAQPPSGGRATRLYCLLFSPTYKRSNSRSRVDNAMYMMCTRIPDPPHRVDRAPGPEAPPTRLYCLLFSPTYKRSNSSRQRNVHDVYTHPGPAPPRRPRARARGAAGRAPGVGTPAQTRSPPARRRSRVVRRSGPRGRVPRVYGLQMRPGEQRPRPTGARLTA